MDICPPVAILPRQNSTYTPVRKTGTTSVQVSSAPERMAPEIVRAVARDPELRALRPGSAEYKTAFEKKFPSKTETPTPASETAGSEAKGSINESSTDKTETPANDTNDAERNLLSKKAQKRFDKLSAEKKALEARVAELETAGKSPKAAETQAKAEETRQAPTSTFDKAKPKIDDFKTISEYQEALTDWKLDKREFDKDQSAKVRTAQETRQKTVETFTEKGKTLEKEMNLEPGDFEIVVNDEGFKMWDVSRQAILEGEFGPQIAFEIASDDGLKDKFSKMTAAQQLREIGKLEAKFEAKKLASAEGSKTVSSAKAPGKSLQKGTSGPKSGMYVPGGDFKSYEAMRKEQRPNKFRV